MEKRTRAIEVRIHSGCTMVNGKVYTRGFRALLFIVINQSFVTGKTYFHVRYRHWVHWILDPLFLFLFLSLSFLFLPFCRNNLFAIEKMLVVD